ncbi:MAG: phage portal protein [Rhodospirillales bacterium]|jgi:HK97 family phage portal protein|nr:phage portal protein [Rhodospirillales bacterium]
MLVDSLISLVAGGLGRGPGLRSIENPNVPLDEAVSDLLEGGEAWSGLRVSRKTALTVSAIWRGVTLVCRDVAKMPLHLYRRVGDGESDRKRAKDHPAYRLLRREPNPEMTAFVFWQTLLSHAIFEGNGYAYIYRRGDASPEELIPMLPDRTAPLRVGGQLYYRTIVAGQTKTFPAADVLHIRGFGYDGVVGYNLIDLAKESVGWQLGLRKYSATFFKNGSRASGVLMTPGRMKGDAAQNLQKSFEREHAGLDKVGRTILLEEGAKYVPITVTQDEAQFLQSMEFGLLDVANWLCLAPHKVGHPSRTSFASLEAENQSHLDEAIDPWAVNIEQECDKKLLSEDQKKNEEYFSEFNRNALVRVDFQTRQEGLRQQIETGQLSPDEARAINNRGPRPDGLGGSYWMPSNMMLAERAAEDEPEPEPPSADPPEDPAEDPVDEDEDGGDRSRDLEAAHRAVLAQACTRAVTWLANKTRNAARNHQKFGQWIDDRGAVVAVAAEIGPATFAATIGTGEDPREAAEGAARRLLVGMQADLLELSGRATKETLADQVETWLAAWESTAAERLAADIWKGR